MSHKLWQLVCFISDYFIDSGCDMCRINNLFISQTRYLNDPNRILQLTELSLADQIPFSKLKLDKKALKEYVFA